jgi:lactate dehydrogenase-like 2-hydroxyacid dehydrogenase
MNGWGVKVIYSNRTKLPSSEEEKLGARYVPLATLLAESDIITLHCPLTPDTRHLFNSKILAQCKKGVYIINTSRGPVIDERALIQALESGQVKRAGLDVFEREPTIESDLFSNNNVILSPHYAAFTHECSMSLFMSLTKVADMDNELLENALAYIETGKPNTPVNNPRASL